jgi:hypothetical protein
MPNILVTVVPTMVNVAGLLDRQLRQLVLVAQQ